MKIIINGKEEVIEKDFLNVLELLKIKKVKMPEMVTVELNGEILEREKFGETIVKEGDKIEFIYYMGGGVKKN